MRRLAAVLAVLTVLAATTAWGQELKPPSQDELRKIGEAVPKQARVQPAKPRRLLVFNRAWGYKHSAIPYGAAAIKAMAEKTGAFEAVFTTDDLSFFEPQNIAAFDAIFFNNTNEEIFLPENLDAMTLEEQARAIAIDERLKKTLVEYLFNGGGLAVTHAGVASFRNWPEYGNIIGARFDNHPWLSGTQVTFKIEEPDHPLAAAFPDKWLTIRDETYQVKEDYSRDKVRVLVSIDTEKTDMKAPGIHRKDGDFAITWVKSYGKGRVCYCAIGHDHDLFWNPVVLQHYLDGIQFVLGDLKADTTPSSRVKKAQVN